MRRWALGLCIVAYAVAPLGAYGQSARTLPRLCFLTFDPPASRTTRFAEFFESLRGMGLVDGETIAIDWMSAEGDGTRYAADAAECVRRKADIIVTTTTPATQAAKAATKAIPIVMVTMSDPVTTGLIASLAKPGGNVTGTALLTADLTAKRLELLSELIPGLSRVLVLFYPADPIAGPQVKALESMARRMNITLVLQQIRTPTDIPLAFDHGVAERAQAVLATSESIFIAEQARLIELAAKFRLPIVFVGGTAARAGGLMSYGTIGGQRLTAGYVDRILQGAKPADLPVEQPTRFELVINLKTAKLLGITVPVSMLARADDVIE